MISYNLLHQPNSSIVIYNSKFDVENYIKQAKIIKTLRNDHDTYSWSMFDRGL